MIPFLASVSRRSLIACAALLAVGAVHAQDAYPSKPIRIVIGYAPGGTVDMVGRVIGDILTKQLGATVVVENVPGAAGVVGAQRVATAKPDGYTLLAGSSNELAGTKFVNPAQKYDPAVDFTPIAQTAIAVNLWVAGAHVPVNNLDDFIKLAKANPGKYTYGSPGIGSTPHFSGELIKKTAGVYLLHIPYRGVPAMTADLGGGNLDFAILSPMGAAPLVQSGKIKILGTATGKRVSILKDVPALSEHPALKGYALTGWFGMAGPKGLPPEIVAKLQKAIQTGLADPAVREKLEAAGTPATTGTEDLGKIIKSDMGKYAELVKFANIKPE